MNLDFELFLGVSTAGTSLANPNSCRYNITSSQEKAKLLFLRIEREPHKYFDYDFGDFPI